MMFFVTSSGCTTKMDAVLSSAGETILHTTRVQVHVPSLDGEQ